MSSTRTAINSAKIESNLVFSLLLDAAFKYRLTNSAFLKHILPSTIAQHLVKEIRLMLQFKATLDAHTPNNCVRV